MWHCGADGYVWAGTMTDCTVHRVAPDGNWFQSFTYSPAYGCLTSGLAVSADNHVWITSRTNPGFVIRVDANIGISAVVAYIYNTGADTSGVSIDNLGKVWATCISSNNAFRIDPATNSIDTFSPGVPAVASLGANAGAYNYGDMTGTSHLSAVIAGSGCGCVEVAECMQCRCYEPHTNAPDHDWQDPSSSALRPLPRALGKRRLMVFNKRTGQQYRGQHLHRSTRH
jgi:hypothetical protein